MQQFAVPQFIDTEPKVLGPVTVRQFVMFLIAGLFIFIEYKLADFGLFLVEAIITAGITVLFAVVKINGRPFHFFLLNVIRTSTRPALRLWQHAELSVRPEEMPTPKTVSVLSPRKVTEERLSHLALVVDTGGAYKGEE